MAVASIEGTLHASRCQPQLLREADHTGQVTGASSLDVAFGHELKPGSGEQWLQV